MTFHEMDNSAKASTESTLRCWSDAHSSTMRRNKTLVDLRKTSLHYTERWGSACRICPTCLFCYLTRQQAQHALLSHSYRQPIKSVQASTSYFINHLRPLNSHAHTPAWPTIADSPLESAVARPYTTIPRYVVSPNMQPDGFAKSPNTLGMITSDPRRAMYAHKRPSSRDI